jgi:hypothetical protein
MPKNSVKNTRFSIIALKNLPIFPPFSREGTKKTLVLKLGPMSCVYQSSSIQTITVGSGIAPDQLPKQFADFTAGGDLHPALKYLFFLL